ncbi:Z band alternatively spliced PDZ-motif protein 52 isoform X3 [Arctopsyche grandis]|uniref:Z band alternatively spliced PDZ-motif protein 52 isoform X3 n=1 Tax=Arctopsyche grandis TaxID=121162 RepID=UPI00406D6615
MSVESLSNEKIAQKTQQSTLVSESSHMQSESAILYQSKTSEPIQTTFNPPLPEPNLKTIDETIQKSECSTQSNEYQESKVNIKHKESICSAEVSNINERKSPLECIETIGEAIDSQNLVLTLTSGNLTPRPPSPTPEDVCSPLIEKKSFDEELNTIQNIGEVESEKTETISEKNTQSIKESETCKTEVKSVDNTRCAVTNIAASKESQTSVITNIAPKTFDNSLVSALTIAPERPFSPLPPTTQAPNICSIPNNEAIKTQEILCEPSANKIVSTSETIQERKIETTSTVTTNSETECKRLFSSIPPIKAYVPSKPSTEPISMPEETVPYFPPDIQIKVEPRPPRTGAVSPFVAALTIAPARPYTPLGSQPIERGSLVEALTVAPQRPFTPANIEPTPDSVCPAVCPKMTCSKPQASVPQECFKPIATQPCQTSAMQTSKAPIQTVCQIQSTQSSAFKPVVKTVQTFPPPPPEEFAEPIRASFPPVSDELKSNFSSNVKHTSESVTMQAMSTESHQMSHRQEFKQQEMKQQSSSVTEFAQSMFEQSETLTSTAKRNTSGLHKPVVLPCYQQNLEQLPSQRGKTPEIINEPPILQKPVTPTIAPDTIDPHVKKIQPPQVMEKTIDCNQNVTSSKQITSILKTSHESQQKMIDFHKDMPISMTFQPVTEEAYSRTTPTIRSRPVTPSSINKPAPLIPHYQMNLVAVEHFAPGTNLFEPSSPDVSRSPTPKLRSRSPAVGPPPNPLKAHAPRLQEDSVQQHQSHSLLSQATSNLRKEHDVKTNFQSGVEVYNTSGAKNWAKNQQSTVKTQQLSKIGFHQSEAMAESNSYNSVSEASFVNQQSMQQRSESQAVYDSGNTSVQRTKKVFEEFERTQSAKVIEIQRSSDGVVTKSVSQQLPSNISQSALTCQSYSQRSIQSSNIQSKSLEFNASSNRQPCTVTNAINQLNMSSKPQPICEHPTFPNSGANNKTSGPVCDPTPSTGGAGSGAGRGKTFGVSSAPKRGRGILNKAAGPGTRVPLCAHCNGHIRGPFISALGRIWCPEHFVCVNNTCRRHLQDIGFVEENGQLYCEYCFEQFIAPACDKCHAKIKGDCLNAIGKHFHPECFCCAYCGKLFGNNPFFLEEGLPYCEADWNELFTTKCFACGFPVEAGDRWVEALNNNYHSQCFNCTMCKKNLEGQSFYAKGGRPFCKNHAR